MNNDNQQLIPCAHCGQDLAGYTYATASRTVRVTCQTVIGGCGRSTPLCMDEEHARKRWNTRAALPTPAPDVREGVAFTGNNEADKVINRLNSSDPDFDDCAAAVALIYKLVAENKGPDGFATWKDAAIASRLVPASAPVAAASAVQEPVSKGDDVRLCELLDDFMLVAMKSVNGPSSNDAYNARQAIRTYVASLTRTEPVGKCQWIRIADGGANDDRYTTQCGRETRTSPNDTGGGHCRFCGGDINLECFDSMGEYRDWMQSEPPSPEPAGDMVLASKAADDVLAERRRQVEAEGWTPSHDDNYSGEMALAASSYALAAATGMQHRPEPDVYTSTIQPGNRWPWDRKWWKPTNPRRDLVKAGALILAEIERVDRKAVLTTKPAEGG